MKLEFSELMRGMCHAPFNHEKCARCGGLGLKGVRCCNGESCGCQGMLVDFIKCECGCAEPTNRQIKFWASEVL